jgi:hypothetical protein
MKAPSINIDVGASARAEVKTEIPAKSAGKLVDALTDIIRPFSEKRGLRADQIRLQREDVLIEIARKARRRLTLEEIEPRAIPNKFLVSFLEQASLEDPKDTTLIDMWSNLLASAAKDGSSENAVFIKTMSQLTKEEAVLFENMLTAYNKIGRKKSFSHYADAPF